MNSIKKPKNKAQQRRFNKTLAQFDEQLVQLLQSYQNRKEGKEDSALSSCSSNPSTQSQSKKGQDRLNQDALQAQLFVYLPKVSTRLSVRLAQREKSSIKSTSINGDALRSS